MKKGRWTIVRRRYGKRTLPHLEYTPELGRGMSLSVPLRDPEALLALLKKHEGRTLRLGVTHRRFFYVNGMWKSRCALFEIASWASPRWAFSREAPTCAFCLRMEPKKDSRESK